MNESAGVRRTYGSHVSRALSAAGFTRAEHETTSVRGYYRYSPGFEVKGCNQSWEIALLNDEERDAGFVTVQEQTIDDFSYGKEKDPRPLAQVVAEQLGAYTHALESAGFEVEHRDRGASSYLVVKGRR